MLKYLILAVLLLFTGCSSDSVPQNALQNPKISNSSTCNDTSKKLRNALVAIPTPGAFVAASLNTGTDETFGVTNSVNTTFDTGDTPITPTWANIPIGSSNWEPGYSLAASANAPSGELCSLLSVVTWNTVAVGYGLHVDGTTHADFDNTDVTFGGVTEHITNAQRNFEFPNKVQGATLIANVENSSEAVCLKLILPTGEVYNVAGLEF